MKRAFSAIAALAARAIIPVRLVGQHATPEQPARWTVDPTTPKKHVLVRAFTNATYHGSTIKWALHVTDGSTETHPKRNP